MIFWKKIICWRMPWYVMIPPDMYQEIIGRK